MALFGLELVRRNFPFLAVSIPVPFFIFSFSPPVCINRIFASCAFQTSLRKKEGSVVRMPSPCPYADGRPTFPGDQRNKSSFYFQLQFLSRERIFRHLGRKSGHRENVNWLFVSFPSFSPSI